MQPETEAITKALKSQQRVNHIMKELAEEQRAWLMRLEDRVTALEMRLGGGKGN